MKQIKPKSKRVVLGMSISEDTKALLDQIKRETGVYPGRVVDELISSYKRRLTVQK